MNERVECTIRYGAFGEKAKTVAVPVPEDVMRELMERVERSDESFSLLLASPGMWGGKGNAVSVRKRVFKMRRDVAEKIAQSMVPALLAAFGVNDELDGYRIEDMSPEERAWHEKRGRLPRAGV